MKILQNLICLDFDNCILEYDKKTPYYDKDLALEQLLLNLKKLDKLANSVSAKFFIISSWSQILNYDSKLKLIKLKDEVLSAIDDYQKTTFMMIASYLMGKTVGVSCGNREEDVKQLLQNNNPKYKIAIIDDFDLSHLNDYSNRVTFFKVEGAINLKTIQNIYNFFVEKS